MPDGADRDGGATGSGQVDDFAGDPPQPGVARLPGPAARSGPPGPRGTS